MGGVTPLKPEAGSGKLMPPQIKDQGAATEHGARQQEEQPVIVADHHSDSGEVGANSADHEEQRHHRAQHGGAAPQQKHDCHDFDKCHGHTAPGLDAKATKNENGFLGSAQLEPEGLSKDERRENLANP